MKGGTTESNWSALANCCVWVKPKTGRIEKLLCSSGRRDVFTHSHHFHPDMVFNEMNNLWIETHESKE